MSDVLIIGASGRAAAWSAIRAGWKPCVVDLFADTDLTAIGPCVRVPAEHYPDGLAEAARSLPNCPFLYTGGLENRPGVIAALSAERKLWGVAPGVLKRVRQPEFLTASLVSAGLPALDVTRNSLNLPRDGTWMAKPFRSTGGQGVLPLDLLSRKNAGKSNRAESQFYYQRRACGLSLSAIFIADGHGHAQIAGVTRQLIGRDGAPFAYRGSVGPWPVSPRASERIEAVGMALAAADRLVGLIGVDLILDEADVPWPVEINPRYTAAVEVLELAYGRSWLEPHRRACERLSFETPAPRDEAPRQFIAKEYVFAEQAGRFPEGVTGAAKQVDPFQVPILGDLPAAGNEFRAGDPVLTVFGQGRNAEEALNAVSAAHRCWQETLAASHASTR